MPDPYYVVMLAIGIDTATVIVIAIVAILAIVKEIALEAMGFLGSVQGFDSCAANVVPKVSWICLKNTTREYGVHKLCIFGAYWGAVFRLRPEGYTGGPREVLAHCLDCSCLGVVGRLQDWKKFRGKQLKFQKEV